MEESAIEKLTTARVGLLLKHPFFGNIATRMKLIDASDWCQTAATDGRNFYYSDDFVNKLSVKKNMFLLAHEICHGIFDHFGRLGSRDKELANRCQDYAINQILADDNIGEVITEVDICLDSKYRGMAWEEIYDLLYDEYEEQKNKSMEEFIKGLGDMLDDHLAESMAGETGEDGKPTMTAGEIEQARKEMRDAMIQSFQAAGAGSAPGSIERLIKDLIEPKMDWREVLRMNIQSIVRNDYTFQRPNRKSWGTGIILPGMSNDETIDVAIAIDMSGSISDAEAKVFLSEVKGILDQYVDFSINLWSFDTSVHNPVKITHDNEEDFYTYDLQGGGGTTFEVNWDYMREEDLNPKKFIMFTDGYPGRGWGDPDYADTLFIIKGYHDTKMQAPFGETVHYEELKD